MASETWQLDPIHSSIGFSIWHLVISKVHGRFGKWNGTVQIDDALASASNVQAQIDVASIDTNEPQRDAHLRSAGFFDVARFPEIAFTGKRVERLGEDRYRVTGELTMRGVTREIALDVEETGRIKDPWGNNRVGFAARTAIDRKDFGLTFNQQLDTGGLMLGDKVEIAIEVEALQAAQAAA